MLFTLLDNPIIEYTVRKTLATFRNVLPGFGIDYISIKS